jgi:hypothetical protein
MLFCNQKAHPCTDCQEKDEDINIIKELSKANTANASMAQFFLRCSTTGAFNFSDANQLQQAIQAFTYNLCRVNDSIVNLLSSSDDKKNAFTGSTINNSPVQAIEFDSGEKSSKRNAAYNSDVTMDNGSAHEQRSRPWVSELADESSDDGYPGLKAVECTVNSECNKKRSFIDTSSARRSTDGIKLTRPKFNPNDVFDLPMTCIEQVQGYLSRSNDHQGSTVHNHHQGYHLGKYINSHLSFRSIHPKV